MSEPVEAAEICICAAPWTRRTEHAEDLRFETCNDLLLESMPMVSPDTQVKVICVQGPARVGKSTTMNLIVLWLLATMGKSGWNDADVREKLKFHGSSRSKIDWVKCRVTGLWVPLCFQTGDTTDACTEGCDAAVVLIPKGCFGRSKDLLLTIVDTEGQGDRSGDYDHKVMLPALLLSSGGLTISHAGQAVPQQAATLDRLQQMADLVTLFACAKEDDSMEASESTAASDQRIGLGPVVVMQRDAGDDPDTMADDKAFLHERIFGTGATDENGEIKEAAGGGAASAASASEGSKSEADHGEDEDEDGGLVAQRRAAFRRTFERGTVELLPTVQLKAGDEELKQSRMDFMKALEAFCDTHIVPCIQDETPRCMPGGVPMQAGAIARILPEVVEHCDQKGAQIPGLLERYNQRALTAAKDGIEQFASSVIESPGVLARCDAAIETTRLQLPGLLRLVASRALGPTTMSVEEALAHKDLASALKDKQTAIVQGLQAALESRRSGAREALIMKSPEILRRFADRHKRREQETLDALKQREGQAGSSSQKHALAAELDAFAGAVHNIAEQANVDATEDIKKLCTGVMEATRRQATNLGYLAPGRAFIRMKRSNGWGAASSATAAGCRPQGASAGVRQLCSLLFECSVQWSGSGSGRQCAPTLTVDDVVSDVAASPAEGKESIMKQLRDEASRLSLEARQTSAKLIGDDAARAHLEQLAATERAAREQARKAQADLDRQRPALEAAARQARVLAAAAARDEELRQKERREMQDRVRQAQRDANSRGSGGGGGCVVS